MKRFWLMSVLVFTVGICVGGVLSRQEASSREPLPYFLQTVPEVTAPASTEPTVAPLDNTQMGLPVALQYTSLVAQGLVSYDGPYWEDGTGEDVFRIASLLLTNTGTVGIEYAHVTVTQNGRILSFDATYIPPRSTVLILEEDRQPYEAGPITDCQCKSVIPGNFDTAQEHIRVESDGLTALKVTNLSDAPIPSLRIYYKHHYGSDDIYLGGITYSITLKNLAPGECRVLYPFRYAVGYSQTVAVTVE